MSRHRHSSRFSGRLVASIILLCGTLGAAPAIGNESTDRSPGAQDKANDDYSTSLLGMTIGPIPEDHPSYGNLGTYVSAVEVDGPAAQAGVRQGYIVVSVRRAEGFVPAKNAQVVEEAIGGEKFTILKFANGSSAMLKLFQLQSRSNSANGAGTNDAHQIETTNALMVADSAPAATTQGIADAHFELEGIRLGMTGARIATILREKGYTSSNDTMNESSRQFWLEKSGELPPPDKFWKGEGRDRPEIYVRYRQLPSLPRGQWPLNEIRFQPGIGARQDAQTEQLFRALVTTYGEPDKCRSLRDRANHTCTWTRRLDEGEETLHWQWMGAASPSLRLTGTNLPPATGRVHDNEDTPSTQPGLSIEACISGCRPKRSSKVALPPKLGLPLKGK